MLSLILSRPHIGYERCKINDVIAFNVHEYFIALQTAQPCGLNILHDCLVVEPNAIHEIIVTRFPIPSLSPLCTAFRFLFISLLSSAESSLLVDHTI